MGIKEILFLIFLITITFVWGYITGKSRKRGTNMEFSYKPVNPFQNDGLSKEDRTLIDGMRNTAYICGYRGEDVEYAVHQALKRMGRYDLLQPCEKDKAESEEDG